MNKVQILKRASINMTKCSLTIPFIWFDFQWFLILCQHKCLAMEFQLINKSYENGECLLDG